MSNLYAESKEYSLSTKSTNTLKIRFIATENISGNKNTINFKINIWTKYIINGTWYFTIKVNNECFNTTCRLSHGTNNSSGETTIREGSVTLNYNNKTSLPIYITSCMDYYSNKHGSSSTKISIPTLNTSLSLSKINTKPKKPEVKLLDCDYKYWRKDNDGNDVYLVKDYIGAYITDKSLINIDEEDGNNVDTYIVVYDAPPWKKITEKNIQYLTGDKRVNIKNYERGHHFYVAAYVKDKCGEKSDESYINIYKNILPEKINYHQIKDNNTYNILNSEYLNNNYILLWKKVSDKEITDLTYNLYLSKNNSEYVLIDNKEIKQEDDIFLSYTQNIDNDPEGTSYKYKICAYDGLEESPAYFTETYYKNNRPTAPKNIIPNNVYRFGNVKISWDSSRDPDKNGIKKYDIYINDKKIESTNNLYCYYNIPNEDKENTKYTIKIQATDMDDGVSDFGIAEFYKEKKIDLPKWIYPKENYYEKSIRLEWERLNTKCEYEIEININDNEWESFIKTQKNYYIHNIENIERGTKIKYRIRCKTQYQITDFVESIQCIKNNIPLQPIIEYPLQNSIVYGKNPRICFMINNEKDNQEQIIYIKYNNIIYNNIENKEMFSITDTKYSTKKNIVFTCPDLNEGFCEIYIYVNDSLINSDCSILNLNIKYLDLNISKEDLISELLIKDISKKINIIRNAYQLNDYNFSDIKNSIIKTNNIKELQNSILELRQKINSYDTTNNYKLLENVSEINKNDYIFANLLNEIIEIIKQP